MSASDDGKTPKRGYWIVATIALLWNLVGVATYLVTVTLDAGALASMPEAERALYEDMPSWVTACYAIAVFGGSGGCLLLLLRKAWAVPVFILSLLAVLLQTGHTLFMTPMVEVLGAASLVLPMVIILVAACLVWFSRSAQQKGWLA